MYCYFNLIIILTEYDFHFNCSFIRQHVVVHLFLYEIKGT